MLLSVCKYVTQWRLPYTTFAILAYAHMYYTHTHTHTHAHTRTHTTCDIRNSDNDNQPQCAMQWPTMHHECRFMWFTGQLGLLQSQFFCRYTSNAAVRSSILILHTSKGVCGPDHRELPEVGRGGEGRGGEGRGGERRRGERRRGEKGVMVTLWLAVSDTALTTTTWRLSSKWHSVTTLKTHKQPRLFFYRFLIWSFLGSLTATAGHGCERVNQQWLWWAAALR